MGGSADEYFSLRHYHLLIGRRSYDDALTMLVVGGGEDVEAWLRIFGVYAEEVYEGMGQEIREDTFIPLAINLLPKVGTLLAELGREVDEERDLYGSGDKGMAHQLGMVFVEERIAVVGEINDDCILLTVSLDNLVDDVVGIEQAIGVGCYYLVLCITLAHGQTVGTKLVEGLRIPLAISRMRPHKMHDLKESDRGRFPKAVGQT